MILMQQKKKGSTISVAFLMATLIEKIKLFVKKDFEFETEIQRFAE